MTQVILYGDKSVHIDGYKSIITFDTNHLCVNCKDKVLNIRGSNLKINSFSGVCMVISGKIDNISWVN